MDGGGGDPMDLDEVAPPPPVVEDDEEEEDLLAGLEQAAPVIVDEDEDKQCGDETSMPQLLDAYHTRLVPSFGTVRAQYDEARRAIAESRDLFEHFLAADAEQRPVRREELIRHQQIMTTQWEMLVAQCELVHVQARLLVNNEIYNHLHRGTQTTPFRVTESLEPVEVALNAANPELGGETQPAVVTRRPQLFV